MLVQQKYGNIKDYSGNKIIDKVGLEWFEANKRILHKITNGGLEISMRFLKENQQLAEGDILFEDDEKIIVIDIIVCDALIIKPASIVEMAAICYEIGNRHLPLFYEAEKDLLLVEYDLPLLRILLANNYDVNEGKRKLINSLKTTVQAHNSIPLASSFEIITPVVK